MSRNLYNRPGEFKRKLFLKITTCNIIIMLKVLIKLIINYLINYYKNKLFFFNTEKNLYNVKFCIKPHVALSNC